MPDRAGGKRGGGEGGGRGPSALLGRPGVGRGFGSSSNPQVPLSAAEGCVPRGGHLSAGAWLCPWAAPPAAARCPRPGLGGEPRGGPSPSAPGLAPLRGLRDKARASPRAGPGGALAPRGPRCGVAASHWGWHLPRGRGEGGLGVAQAVCFTPVQCLHFSDCHFN